MGSYKLRSTQSKNGESFTGCQYDAQLTQRLLLNVPSYDGKAVLLSLVLVNHYYKVVTDEIDKLQQLQWQKLDRLSVVLF